MDYDHMATSVLHCLRLLEVQYETESKLTLSLKCMQIMN